MDPTITVAIVALALSGAVQVAGVAFIFGKLSARVDGLRKALDRH